MKERYLNLMEKTLSAYTDAHIIRYFEDVQQNGLKEHGFPRLTANIGILISNGRRKDLTTLFSEMMEFCCTTIPARKAANDFSVRELVCCIWELEKNNTFPPETISRWKKYLATISPERCYSVYAETPTDRVWNWALFSGVSEFFRHRMLGGEVSEFIETQIASQLKWLDENGMYKDGQHEVHNPMVYDLVPRGLFTALLFAGYRGKYYETIDNAIKTAGLLTLKMQSITGELAFGGRSNQFLHNEAWLAAIFEYEAVRYQKEGNYALAGKFKAAAIQALKPCERWLAKTPISHVKNRFPLDTKHGCEEYAYFDKYMITFASFLYMADMFSNDSIVPLEFDDSPMVWSTSKHFHKTFARAGGYSLEFDINADPHYDANGLGRIHKGNAPSSICLSMPFPAKPEYSLGGFENPCAFSICPAIKDEQGEWYCGAEYDVSYTLTDSRVGKEDCLVAFDCIFANGNKVRFVCSVHQNGVVIQAEGGMNQEVGICLPIFSFDGETYTRISERDNKIFVEYDGWVCAYETDGFRCLEFDVANRNGIYKRYLASGIGRTQIHIKIHKLEE